jgi:hypothetical protein
MPCTEPSRRLDMIEQEEKPNDLMKRGICVVIFLYVILGIGLAWFVQSMEFHSDDWYLIDFGDRTYSTLFTTNWRGEARVGAFYRPIVRLSFYWNYVLSHGEPGLFHVTNAFFHTIASLLVFFLSRSIFPHQGRWVPLLASLLFFVLPIHTDSIFWICARTDTICAIFYFLTVLFFLKYLSSPSAPSLLLTTACFWGALLSKEMAIALPGILIVLAMYRRKLRNRQTWHLLTPVLISYAFYFLIRYSVLGVFLGSAQHTRMSLKGLLAYVRNTYIVFSTGGLFPLSICIPLLLAVMVFFHKRNPSVQRDFRYMLILFFASLVPTVARCVRWYLYIPSVFACLLLTRVWFETIYGTSLTRRERILFIVLLITYGAFGLQTAFGWGTVSAVNPKWLYVPPLLLWLMALRIWFGFPCRRCAQIVAYAFFAGLVVFYSVVLVHEGICWQKASKMAEEYLHRTSSQVGEPTSRLFLVNIPAGIRSNWTKWEQPIYPWGIEKAIAHHLTELRNPDVRSVTWLFILKPGEPVSSARMLRPNSYLLRCTKNACFWYPKFEHGDRNVLDIPRNWRQSRETTFRLNVNEGDKVLFFDGVSVSEI